MKFLRIRRISRHFDPDLSAEESRNWVTDLAIVFVTTGYFGYRLSMTVIDGAF